MQYSAEKSVLESRTIMCNVVQCSHVQSREQTARCLVQICRDFSAALIHMNPLDMYKIKSIFYRLSLKQHFSKKSRWKHVKVSLEGVVGGCVCSGRGWCRVFGVVWGIFLEIP